MKRYRLTPEARGDLIKIRNWIAVDSPRSAATIIAALTELFALLGRSPLIGRDQSGLRSGVRSFRRGNYIVFYRIEGRLVVILRVAHGRRDLSHIFDA